MEHSEGTKRRKETRIQIAGNRMSAAVDSLFASCLQVVPTIFRIGVRLREGPAIIYLRYVPFHARVSSTTMRYVYVCLFRFSSSSNWQKTIPPHLLRLLFSLSLFRHFNNVRLALIVVNLQPRDFRVTLVEVAIFFCQTLERSQRKCEFREFEETDSFREYWFKNEKKFVFCSIPLDKSYSFLIINNLCKFFLKNF